MWNTLGRLLSVPKGFGKFYPKGSAGKAGKRKAKTGHGVGGRGGGGGTGGGGNSGPELPEGPYKQVAAVMGGLLVTFTMFGLNSKNGRYVLTAWSCLFLAILCQLLSRQREISWQDFQSQLMESGMVDRIIVTNKNVAKVVLRGPPPEGSDAFGEDDAAATNPRYDTSTSAFEDADGTARSPAAVAADKNAAGGNSSRYPGPRMGSPNPANAIAPYYFNIGSVESFERKMEDAQKNLNIAPRDFIPVVYVNEASLKTEAMRLVPTVLSLGFIYFLMTRMGGGAAGGGGPGGIFKIGKSTAKKIAPESVEVTFADVAGCDDAKLEIKEFIDFLKEPKRFTDLGAKIPKGALLCGPPGTGKTMLAKATAGEANVPFYSISGSDFVEMFVGVGPARVRGMGGNDERENTLNQLLVEMDGFDTTANIVLLAGTNRVDVLDAALTRAGRFDRQITVDKPDLQGRRDIFEVHLQNINLSGKSMDYSSRLAALTPGFVGADIANMCNEAAIVAARRSKDTVDLDDFEKATDRLIMSAEEKKVVAFHEAGHAVAGWNLKYADPLLKVTIVPRGSGALGYAQYLPKEIFLRTREQILDIVCMALAGRAAEQINFGNVTTGAADDLRRVTQIVYQMVQVYGMTDSIGQVSFPREENGFGGSERLYSEATAEVMDAEVKSIVSEAYQRTLDLITLHRDQVTLVAEMLLEKETITNGDVTNLIGARPHSAGPEYEEYANSGWKKPVEEAVISDTDTSTSTTADDVEPLVPGFAAKV
eukprot:GSChrysophyteH2.ASY1.ANO1.954.1 assembled CDS